MQLFDKNRAKIDCLRWFDIGILTILFWGSAIVNSTQAYIGLIQKTATTEGATDFSSADNYYALFSQLIVFVIALLYLKIRNFNFSNWNINVGLMPILLGCFVYAGAAIIFSIYDMITGNFSDMLPFPCCIYGFMYNETVSTVIYSIFNGIYEELYFLGICLAVDSKHIKRALIFSLIVRVSFHTYQGMLAAIGIGIVFGLYMYLLFYKSKDKNMVPFFWGHALADIFGLSVLWVLGR